MIPDTTITNLIEQISKSGWLAIPFLLVIVAPLLLRAFRDLLAAKLEIAKISSRATELDLGPDGKPIKRTSARPEESAASNLVVDNIDILEKYYDQTLAENRLLSRTAIAVSLLGFFVILVGVSLAFSGYTSVGIVSSVAGLLAEAATIMFFNQLKNQVKQVQDYHKKLVSTQYIMTTIALAKDLNGSKKDEETVRIITNLLFLSNELHGSNSKHLFPVDKPASSP